MVNEETRVPVVYLFHEGDTELGYLQTLAKDRIFKVISKCRKAAPVKLIESAIKFAVEEAEHFRESPNTEIWVIFDHDGKARDMAEVKTALSKCPSICIKGCRTRNIANCKAKDFIERINVAFMSPCIELWGILCTEEGSRRDSFPLDRHKLQGDLHKIMPRYSHISGAQFDVNKMVRTDVAVKRAKDWARTYGRFPDCLNASHYAGIFPLVEKILAAPLKSTDSWRRR